MFLKETGQRTLCMGRDISNMGKSWRKLSIQEDNFYKIDQSCLNYYLFIIALLQIFIKTNSFS